VGFLIRLENESCIGTRESLKIGSCNHNASSVLSA